MSRHPTLLIPAGVVTVAVSIVMALAGALRMLWALGGLILALGDLAYLSITEWRDKRTRSERQNRRNINRLGLSRIVRFGAQWWAGSQLLG